MPGMRGPSPFLRVQSDERLIAITRRGNQAAYEVLVARYHARLLAFTRHMLGSTEDAEDVLQETFAAAYGAMVADERPINLKPWLYRIARNRSLNQMRRQTAIGVDDFDHHVADHGRTTADTVYKREEFRQLIADVGELAETQRTALLLREIDALSYDQIAEAMETTVPSVKSLLVRARVSLAEASEARKLSCEQVRDELGEVAEGLTRITPAVRRHVRDCERCTIFRKSLRENNRALAMMLPIGPLLILKKLLLAQLGTTASAGGGAAAGAAATTVATTAGGTAASGALSAGVSAIASKAAATVAAAALVTAATVEVDHVRNATPQRSAAIVVAAPATVGRPAVKPGPQAAAKPPSPRAETGGTAAPVATPAPSPVAALAPAPAAPQAEAPPATTVETPAAAPAPAPPEVQIAPEEQVDVVTLPPTATAPVTSDQPVASAPLPEQVIPTLPEQPAPVDPAVPAEPPVVPPAEPGAPPAP